MPSPSFPDPQQPSKPAADRCQSADSTGLFALLNRIREAGNRTSRSLDEIEAENQRNTLFERLIAAAEGRKSPPPAASDKQQSQPPSAAGEPQCADKESAEKPPAAPVKDAHEKEARFTVERLAQTCRMVSAEDPAQQNVYQISLQLNVNDSWQTVVSYVYKNGTTYKYSYWVDRFQRPFRMDLPLPVVREMASEDFQRNWAIYCREFARQFDRNY